MAINGICDVTNKAARQLLNHWFEVVAGGANKHQIPCPHCKGFKGWVPVRVLAPRKKLILNHNQPENMPKKEDQVIQL